MKKPIFNSVQRGNFNGNPSKNSRDRQEHWYVDKLLIGDAHSDNAYAEQRGRSGALRNQPIEGSNSVLKRDWDRLGDYCRLPTASSGCDQLKALSESERGKYQSQAKIFRVPWSCSIWYAYGVTSRSSLPGR